MLLSDLPRRGVTRLPDMSVAAVTSAADRRAPSDPVVVVPGLTQPIAASPNAVIDDVLARTAAVAIELFPAWLPNPEQAPESGSILDRLTARSLSHRHDGAPGVGTALGALATVALRRGKSGRGFDALAAADRRGAIEYALTRSYHAPVLALALDVPEPLTARQADALAVAAQWLARGDTAVWLLGASALDRFPTVDGPPPAPEPPEPPGALSGLRPVPAFPPLSGRPHPASVAESRLEEGLAGRGWAADRHWNRTVELGPLHPPVRVDLLFPTARLVVEVDGPDHRTREKYEADRRRDADLMLAGYRVLRLTNARIETDLSDAVSVLRRLVVSDDDTAGGA